MNRRVDIIVTTLFFIGCATAAVSAIGMFTGVDTMWQYNSTWACFCMSCASFIIVYSVIRK